MKRFATKLLLFLIIFLAYDKIFLIVANKSADAEADKRLELLVKGEINKDIVVIGSSRGARAIIASQIEDSTGLSAYNLCYPGSNVEYHDFIVQTLVKFNKAPKLILLVVDDNQEFRDGGPRILFRRDRLYPLVKYPYIWKEMANRGYLDGELASIIVLQRLNKYNFNLKQKTFGRQDTVISCGSMPYSWQREGVNWEYDASERLYPWELEEPGKVAAFQNMIHTCKENNIDVAILFPPNFYSHSTTFEERIRFLSHEASYYHLFDSVNPIYKDKDYFFDIEHLMRDGAEAYTNEVIAFINEVYGSS